jgi:hypothetical protein
LIQRAVTVGLPISIRGRAATFQKLVFQGIKRGLTECRKEGD